MQIRPVTLGALVLPPTVGRSLGVHMSDLYNDYYAVKEPKRFDTSKPMDVIRVVAGLALESALEDGLARQLGVLLGGERPGELTTANGLPFSPDLILFDARGTVLGEIKCTWMSCRECPISAAMAKEAGLSSSAVNWDGTDPDVTFPKKFDKYFTQILVYSYHLHIRHARLFICFINADYRPPKPVLLYWDLEFTQREIDEEWQKISNHARTRGIYDATRNVVDPAGGCSRRPNRKRAR